MRLENPGLPMPRVCVRMFVLAFAICHDERVKGVCIPSSIQAIKIKQGQTVSLS